MEPARFFCAGEEKLDDFSFMREKDFIIYAHGK